MLVILQTSWSLLPGVAKLRQPPWFFLELMLSLGLMGVLVSTQLSIHRPYVRQAAFAQALPFANEARNIIELHWSLYGVFPADLATAAGKPGLRRWQLLDLLDDKANRASDSYVGPGHISYRIDYNSSGRFSLVATEQALKVGPVRIDFVPTIVGKPGAQSVRWQCFDALGDTLGGEGQLGLKVAPRPVWCDTQPSVEGR